MKAMLHAVTGKNRFCGPTAIATILGITTDHAARIIRGYSGRRSVTGTSLGEMAYALRESGCTLSGSGIQHLHKPVKERPTAAMWLRGQRLEPGKHVILIFGNHYGVILGRQYLCSLSGRERVPLSQVPMRRARVLGWLVVETLPASTPIEAAQPKRQDSQRKAREEANRLADLHGISIERLRDGINVWPPMAISDTDRDPYDGDHFANDWSDALEMVQAYAKAISSQPDRR